MWSHGTRSGYKVHKCKCDGCRAWGKSDARSRYLRNAEAMKERSRAKYAANPEWFAEYNRQHRATNPEYHRARSVAWVKANPEKKLAQVQRYRAKNPDKAKANDRRQRERRNLGRDVIGIEYAEILRRDPCVYCGRRDRIEIDHIEPLSVNGCERWDNLTAACRSCNASKYNRSLSEYLLARKTG